MANRARRLPQHQADAAVSRRQAAPAWQPATISEAAGVRYLHLGTPWVQGAMRLRKPLAIELDYVQRMMAWLLLRPTDDWAGARAVQLGLGAATITRFCHGPLQMDTTAVEINPTVIEACRLWFKLPADAAQLQVLAMDAADYVADCARAGTADALCIDLYDHQAASPVLDSDDFYRDAASLVATGGTMTVNLFGRDAAFARSAARIAAAFDGGLVFSLQPTRQGNTVVVAAKQSALPERQVLAERAETIESRFGLPARKWLRMIRGLPSLDPLDTGA